MTNKRALYALLPCSAEFFLAIVSSVYDDHRQGLESEPKLPKIIERFPVWTVMMMMMLKLIFNIKLILKELLEAAALRCKRS